MTTAACPVCKGRGSYETYRVGSLVRIACECVSPTHEQRRADATFIRDAVEQLNYIEMTGTAEDVLRHREYVRRCIIKLEASTGLGHL